MSRKFRYLITGREGQVVRSLLEQGQRPQHSDLELIAIGRPDLDLARPDTIVSVVEEIRPDLIISAAAYTAVDQAERDEETARQVNALGPRALGEAAAKHQIPIVHLSTDYVFDGTKSEPYEEADRVAPLGVYGRTKLEGEQFVLQASQNVAVLRTAWVYSPFGKNFAKTMLRVAEASDTVRVVSDQTGNPTSAHDIALGILQVARNLLEDASPRLRGVFHMTGQGTASWADFAEEIFRVSLSCGGPTAKVQRILTKDYPTPAQRPANSRLNCSALRTAHQVELPQWTMSTVDIIERLVTTRAYL